MTINVANVDNDDNLEIVVPSMYGIYDSRGDML